jgi:hypothetical protein
MEELVSRLCSDECAGRKPGTKGGLLARSIVCEQLERLGFTVREQPIPRIGGANLVAELPGSGKNAERAIVVGAHYDHLGQDGRRIYRGADDNAAAVAILLEAARKVAHEFTGGRRVTFIAFDAEESPYFRSGDMGSEVFAEETGVAHVDAMIAMDLVGHAVGREGLPDPVRKSLFVLGAEKGGLGGFLHSRPGLFVRRLDAEVIPPLSDYDAYWRRRAPFLFLTCGRSSVYHTPEDTPDRLDFEKMRATGDFLAELVLDLAQNAPLARYRDERDDAASVESIIEIATLLAPFAPQAAMAVQVAQQLHGRALSEEERRVLGMIVAGLEQGLA